MTGIKGCTDIDMLIMTQAIFNGIPPTLAHASGNLKRIWKINDKNSWSFYFKGLNNGPSIKF